MMTVVEVPLRSRLLVRLGWGVVGAACALVAGSGWWIAVGSVVSSPLRAAVSVGLAVLYTPAAIAGVRMATARRPSLRVADARVVIDHPGVLGEPIVATVAGCAVDPRSSADRRVAATVRRSVVGIADFVDPSIPVVSDAPSSHSDHGTAQVPNVVLFLRQPIDPPPVTWGVRLLLRVSVGRTGRYRGPRRKQPIEAVRLVVDDAAALAALLPLVERARNERYLRPIVARDRSKARRHRLILAGITVGIGLLVVLVGLTRAV